MAQQTKSKKVSLTPLTKKEQEELKPYLNSVENKEFLKAQSDIARIKEQLAAAEDKAKKAVETDYEKAHDIRTKNLIELGKYFETTFLVDRDICALKKIEPEEIKKLTNRLQVIQKTDLETYTDEQIQLIWDFGKIITEFGFDKNISKDLLLGGLVLLNDKSYFSDDERKRQLIELGCHHRENFSKKAANQKPNSQTEQTA